MVKISESKMAKIKKLTEERDSIKGNLDVLNALKGGYTCSITFRPNGDYGTSLTIRGSDNKHDALNSHIENFANEFYAMLCGRYTELSIEIAELCGLELRLVKAEIETEVPFNGSKTD